MKPKFSILLALLSLILSRAAFFLIDDPEGPNLLIVVVLAAIIFSAIILLSKLIKHYVLYAKDNPEHYWFKRKIYGWGWVPVTWQGWLVVLVAFLIFLGGLFVGATDDAPGATLLGLILMLTVIFYFGYTKGEKPRWQWGDQKDYN